MKIESITIRGFRCFDETGQTIYLDDFTCFIGPNASGKTAAMLALSKLFGESNAQRQISPQDFHLPLGEDLKAKPSRHLMIECRLAFPEFEGNSIAGSVAIPETFNQMIVDEPGGTPYCRVRLEATWTDNDNPAGDVDQDQWWILTSSDDPAIIESNRRPIQAANRGKIRVIYVPAARDPDQQIRITTSTSFGRLLNAISWGETDKSSVKKAMAELQRQLEDLTGIKTINLKMQSSWSGFYPGQVVKEVALRAFEKEPDSLLKLLVPQFSPGEDGSTVASGELSDGLKSLFSISLSLGLFRVEELLRRSTKDSGFKAEIAEKLPMLTVFAVEEPENHLSPHYLGRVMSELTSIAVDSQAQVIVSSHSPSILGRVEPDHVRYFLGDERTRQTQVKPIPLPENKDEEAYKYIRQAVRGFPELYFAHLVILGEGASEEIVLRCLFEASGAPLDKHFVSVVPLGGRHVNHFWRLLQGVGIRYLTLLDLDREKEGAGWGRVQYVRDQLIQWYGKGHEKLQVIAKNGELKSLEDEACNHLGNSSDSDVKRMNAWLRFFEKRFGVYFSSPLDLDFAMLEAFPEAYKSLAPKNGGPRLPNPDEPNYRNEVKQRMKQVLAADASKATVELGQTYTEAQQELFAWYKYLFVDGAKKPTNHMLALSKIERDDLKANAPDVLKKLVERAQTLIEEENGGA